MEKKKTTALNVDEIYETISFCRLYLAFLFYEKYKYISCATNWKIYIDCYEKTSCKYYIFDIVCAVNSELSETVLFHKKYKKKCTHSVIIACTYVYI